MENPKENGGYAINGKLVNGFHICQSETDAFLTIDDLKTWSEFNDVSLVVCKVEMKENRRSGPVNWDQYFHPQTIVANKCKIIGEVKRGQIAEAT